MTKGQNGTCCTVLKTTEFIKNLNPLWRVFYGALLQENKKARYFMGLKNTGQKN